MKKKFNELTLVEHAMICSQYHEYKNPCCSDDGKECPLAPYCNSIVVHDLSVLFTEVEIDVDNRIKEFLSRG